VVLGSLWSGFGGCVGEMSLEMGVKGGGWYVIRGVAYRESICE